jgi:hypothetical protein
MENLYTPDAAANELEHVPQDIRTWYALCETMKRLEVGMVELTENDISEQDRAVADDYLRQVTEHMDEDARGYYLDSLRSSMEMMEQAVERVREYTRAYEELVGVIGEDKGRAFSTHIVEVNSWLIQKMQDATEDGTEDSARQSGVQKVYSIIAETPRVAIERMVANGVTSREMQALARYLATYQAITDGGKASTEAYMADRATSDEDRMVKIREELSKATAQ